MPLFDVPAIYATSDWRGIAVIITIVTVTELTRWEGLNNMGSVPSAFVFSSSAAVPSSWWVQVYFVSQFVVLVSLRTEAARNVSSVGLGYPCLLA